MKIVIIEDEQLTAEVLKDILVEISTEHEIIKILNSVEESIEFFKTENEVDLIFSDIQLGDGLSFEIFNNLVPPAPIIFCTAYDEYALEAFNTNGIHYILKPFNASKIEESLRKFEFFKSNFQTNTYEEKYKEILSLLKQRRNDKNSSILVSKKDRIVPIRLSNIAIMYIDNGISYILTFDGERYYSDKTISELFELCSDAFFRANRQFIVNREAIKEVGESLSRKSILHLKISFSEEITVSKERKTEFLDWLKGN